MFVHIVRSHTVETMAFGSQLCYKPNKEPIAQTRSWPQMLTLTLGVAVVQHWRTQAAPAGDHKKGGKQNAWILTCLPGSRNANVIMTLLGEKTIHSVDFFVQTYALVERRGNAMLVIACATGRAWFG